uniref:Reverse transcriptase n=1 Tax=Steinernema glaseri TaxID=37863 RepID=A0A1I8ADF8_9BILA
MRLRVKERSMIGRNAKAADIHVILWHLPTYGLKSPLGDLLFLRRTGSLADHLVCNTYRPLIDDFKSVKRQWDTPHGHFEEDNYGSAMGYCTSRPFRKSSIAKDVYAKPPITRATLLTRTRGQKDPVSKPEREKANVLRRELRVVGVTA